MPGNHTMLTLDNPSGCLSFARRRKTRNTQKQTAMHIIRTTIAAALSIVASIASAAPAHVITIGATGLAADSVTLSFNDYGSSVQAVAASWSLGGPTVGKTALEAAPGAALDFLYEPYTTHYGVAHFDLTGSTTTFSGIDLDQITGWTPSGFDWSETVARRFLERNAFAGSSMTVVWADGFEAYIPASGFSPLTFADAVTPVPEPATPVLMLAGLLAVGFVARKTGSQA